MGYRPNCLKEDFHAYMSRLYREQGMPRGESPYLQTRLPQPLYAQFWQFLSKQGWGHSTGIQYARCSTPQKPQRTMLNITAVGRLGKDPELRTTQKGQEITSFSLSVSVFAKGEQQTVWLKCSIWGKRGETLRNYCSKGQQITISGKLFEDEWMGKEGEVTDLCVDVAGLQRCRPVSSPSSKPHAEAVTA